jgi:murein DD-endopeptidase MepM/ murein hydrolase activator NlpD
LERYRLTARFGASNGPWTNGHTGLDFAAPSGTPVRAVAAGRVMSAEWAGAYGWQVIVRHAAGTETWYCHLSSMSVRSGDVQAGDVIGRVGSTGNTSGPHLHLEVRVGGNPTNPATWLGARGVAL